MADFSALKTSIQNYIKQNGNEEITGNLLQQILLSMVTTLGDSAINDLVTALNTEIANRGNADTTLQGNINSEATTRANADTELGGRITTLQGVVNGVIANVENGYVYAGIATPSSTPASGKVFYLALTAGTYTNFGATVVPQGINILKYNGSAWSLDSFLGLDDAPTQGSNNLVKSGGVLDSIIKDGSAFDLSAYNNGTTYADLSAALTALNALPAAYKKGGMSIKYVQSSDNKYVQARCMAQNFTTDVTQWQGVDDEPLTNSKNLITSGGVASEVNKIKDGCELTTETTDVQKQLSQSDFTVEGVLGTNGILSTSPSWTTTLWRTTEFIPIKGGTTMEAYLSDANYGSSMCVYSDANEDSFISAIPSNYGRVITGNIPSNAKYFRVSTGAIGQSTYLPNAYLKYTAEGETYKSGLKESIDELNVEINKQIYGERALIAKQGTYINGQTIFTNQNLVTGDKIIVKWTGNGNAIYINDTNGNVITAYYGQSTSIETAIVIPSNFGYASAKWGDLTLDEDCYKIIKPTNNAILDWCDKQWVSYGDSLTAMFNNGDFIYPYLIGDNTGWGLRVADYHKFKKFFGRGISGTSFMWSDITNEVWLVDSNTGAFAEKITGQGGFDDFSGTVPQGETLCRSIGCSWNRITTMIPSSIKDNIDVVTLFFHNDGFNENDNWQWIEGDDTDPEWAESTYYSTYGGDYNIRTFQGAVISTIMKMQAWMPNARIVLCTCFTGETTEADENKIDPTLTDRRAQKKSEYIRTIAKKLAVPVIDVNAECSVNMLNRTLYLQDYIHPNALGNKRIAQVFIGGFKEIIPNLT